METVNTTQELFQKARTFLRQGHTVSKACICAGIPRSTYYALVKKKRKARMKKLEEMRAAEERQVQA